MTKAEAAPRFTPPQFTPPQFIPPKFTPPNHIVSIDNMTSLDSIHPFAADLCNVGRSLFERGYVHGSTGNISVRLPASDGGGCLITPTDACLGFLDPARLARIDAQGNQVAGDRASKTLVLHQRIYAADPTASCVIHTHSSHLVGLTLKGVWRNEDVLPPVTPYYVMKVGHVPLIPYVRPGAPEVAEQIAHHIQSHAARGLKLRAVLCDRLGPQVWSDTLSNAMAILEELEETARIWLRSGCSAEPLSEAAIEELRLLFKASW